MYPSTKATYYGTFVRDFHLKANEFFDVKLICLHKENNKLLKLISYFFFYIKIVFGICIFHYDIVYAHYVSHVAKPLLFCKKLKDYRLFINVHGSDVLPPKKSLGEKFLPYTRAILLKAERVIVPSYYFFSVMREEFNLSPDNISVYPSGGVNPAIFHVMSDETKHKTIAKYDLSYDYEYIGFASRLIKEKGWKIYLEAVCALLRDRPDFGEKYRFILIGSGPCEVEVDNFINKENLNVYVRRFLSLPQNELSSLFNLLSWFIFPSESESLGLVGLEAMACAVPVIATNFAGPTTYVKDDINGLLFNKGEAIDLERALIAALDMDKERYNTLKNNCIATAMRYMGEELQESFMDIFRKGNLI